MAKEKTRNDIINNIVKKESQIPPIYNYPSDAKYKPRHKKDIQGLPEISVGKKVVVRVNKKSSKSSLRMSDVDGYLLCQILDYDSIENFWSLSTDIIVLVLKVSQEHLKDQIGRLFCVSYEPGRSWFSSHRAIVSFNENFVKFL